MAGIRDMMPCNAVSGILFHFAMVPVIYLDLKSPSGSNDLPPGKERAAPCFAFRQNLPVYLVFQPIRFTRSGCHQPEPWALTPRFHPYPDAKGNETVIFCGTCCFRRLRNLPVRKYGALCCPDFPPPFLQLGATEHVAVPLMRLCYCKITK